MPLLEEVEIIPLNLIWVKPAEENFRKAIIPRSLVLWLFVLKGGLENEKKCGFDVGHQFSVLPGAADIRDGYPDLLVPARIEEESLAGARDRQGTERRVGYPGPTPHRQELSGNSRSFQQQ